MGRCPLRHARRARSHKQGRLAVSPYRTILGANLVAMWHSQLGIALASGNVDTWTDQIGGRVLQAPSAGRRMLYTSNGAFSSGKSMPQSVAASTSCVFGTGLTTLFATSTRPWVIHVARVVSFTAANQAMWSVSDGSGNGGPFVFATAAGNSLNTLSGASLAFTDTAAAHTFEQGRESPNEYVGFDGSYASVASGVLTGGARNTVCIGMNEGSVQPMSCVHALWLGLTSRPTAPQVAAVTAQAKAEFGF